MCATFQIKVERERLQKEKAEREAAIDTLRHRSSACGSEGKRKRTEGKYEAASHREGEAAAYRKAAEYLRSLTDEPNREESSRD